MISLQKQTSNNTPMQDMGDFANGKFKAFEQAEKAASSFPKDKTINGNISLENIEANSLATYQTAPHLQKELKVGSSNVWNESFADDADNEQEELDKNVKRKTRIVEVESEETRARRINQASQGDAF